MCRRRGRSDGHLHLRPAPRQTRHPIGRLPPKARLAHLRPLPRRRRQRLPAEHDPRARRARHLLRHLHLRALRRPHDEPGRVRRALRVLLRPRREHRGLVVRDLRPIWGRGLGDCARGQRYERIRRARRAVLDPVLRHDPCVCGGRGRDRVRPGHEEGCGEQPARDAV